VILDNVPPNNVLRRFETNILDVYFDTSVHPSFYHQLLKDLVSHFGKKIHYSRFLCLDAGYPSLIVQGSLQNMAMLRAHHTVANCQEELLALGTKANGDERVARRMEHIRDVIQVENRQLQEISFKHDRNEWLWEDIEEKVRELLKDDVDAKAVTLRVVTRKDSGMHRERERNENLEAVEKQKRVVKMWQTVH
jgi:hypothetical protein